jgi:uncharacterized membrane protein
MVDKLLALLAGSSAELITAVLAMLPVSELRGAIPYAVGVAGMSWQKAYVIAVIANFIPVIPIFYLIGPVSDYLRKVPLFDRFFTWLFARARRKGKLIERFKRVALPAIFLGICIAGVVVTLAVTGVISFWGIATGRSGG